MPLLLLQRSQIDQQRCLQPRVLKLPDQRRRLPHRPRRLRHLVRIEVIGTGIVEHQRLPHHHRRLAGRINGLCLVVVHQRPIHFVERAHHIAQTEVGVAEQLALIGALGARHQLLEVTLSGHQVAAGVARRS
jgi:hypothetical protein